MIETPEATASPGDVSVPAVDELDLAPATAAPVIGSAPSEDSIDLAEIARMVPDKMGFKIGEVADIAGLKTYVLRYWETEFDALSPQKSAFNQRIYSKRDVETVLLIKKLLYDEKFSIAGAKKKIRELRKELKAEKQWVEVNDKVELAVDKLSEMLVELSDLKALFKN